MGKNIVFMTFIAGMMFGAIGAQESLQEEREALREGIIEENRVRNEALEAANQERLKRRMQGLPTNPDETPTSTKVIYHHRDFVVKGPRYDVEEARIWFNDRLGHPCYRTIAEHFEKNPDFHEVPLVVHKPGWFSNSFEIIGTVADENAREQFKKVLADGQGNWFFPDLSTKGGLWCPAGNAFIGGTRDTSECDAYVRCLTKEQKIEQLKREIDMFKKQIKEQEKELAIRKQQQKEQLEKKIEQFEKLKALFDKNQEE